MFLRRFKQLPNHSLLLKFKTNFLKYNPYRKIYKSQVYNSVIYNKANTPMNNHEGQGKKHYKYLRSAPFPPQTQPYLDF